jgi:lysophospholipase L1-like esterase
MIVLPLRVAKVSSAALMMALLLAPATVAGPLNQRLAPELPGFVLGPQSIEDPDGQALLGFYRALRRTEIGESTGTTRIVHYGDSHIAADLLTGAVRRRLQDSFGDGGPGFIDASDLINSFPRGKLSSMVSDGWRIDGISRTKLRSDGRLGLAGISLTADQPGESIRLRTIAEHFEVYLLKQPGGGALQILMDGRLRLGRVALSGGAFEPAYCEIEAPSAAPHLFELRTIEPGPVRVLGVLAQRKNPGVVYDAFGINGARAYRPLEWDQAIFVDNLRRRAPDLIVISYGTNEAGDADFDVEEYARSFSALLSVFRKAAPAASILVIAPPDRAIKTGGAWRSLGRMSGLVEAQRFAAKAAGAAFWNLYRAMGGAGSILEWSAPAARLAQPDRAHLTRSGYRLVGDTLYRELMRGYLLTLLIR